VFHLSESDSGRVAVGNPVSLGVSSHPGRRFEAVVTVVSPTIDSASRTLRVKARVDDPEGELRPGLFAHVELGVAERTGVPMIPEEAVLQRTSGSVVFSLKDDQRVERVSVETGTHREGLVEIRSGLAAGDWVVIQGQAGLVDDLAVVAQDMHGNPLGARLAAKPAGDVGGVQ
jgi:membrane fusion protein (multidrug efflux system)